MSFKYRVGKHGSSQVAQWWRWSGEVDDSGDVTVFVVCLWFLFTPHQNIHCLAEEKPKTNLFAIMRTFIRTLDKVVPIQLNNEGEEITRRTASQYMIVVYTNVLLIYKFQYV